MIPASYQKKLETQSSADGRVLQVSWEQDGLDRVAGSGSGGQPFKDTRIISSTRYTFEPGQITRIDTYTPNGAQAFSKIELESGSFSEGATALGGNRFSYASGDVTGFEVEGLQECTVADVSADTNYNTPGGGLKTSIRCATPAFSFNQPLVIKWMLKYRAGSFASFAPH